MKYLKISNDGVITIDSLKDIASSSKRFKYIINESSLDLLMNDLNITGEEYKAIHLNLLNHAFSNDIEFQNAIEPYLTKDFQPDVRDIAFAHDLDVIKKYCRNKFIGQYGTGLKQAYCYFLRENIKFKIFSGLQEFDVYKIKRLSSGVYSDFVVINGQQTDLNIAFGIEDYNIGMSISEVWTNAIDAGNHKYEIVDETEILPEVNKTVIYIEYNDAVEKFVNNWNEYFAFERKDIIYQDGEEDVSGVKIFGDAKKLFDKLIVYRRGIQVYVYERPSIFHYNIDNIEITGSRIVKDRRNLDMRIYEILASKIPKELVEIICDKLSLNNNLYEHSLDWDWNGAYFFGSSWEEVLGKSKIVEKEKKHFYETVTKEVEDQGYKVYNLPGKLVNSLINKPSIDHVNGDFSKGKKAGKLINQNELEQNTLSYIIGLRKAAAKIIPNIVYLDIQFIKPQDRNASFDVTSHDEVIYININNVRSRTVQQLLVSINIENQKMIKYKNDTDSYGVTIERELSELVLRNYNNDYDLGILSISTGNLCWTNHKLNFVYNDDMSKYYVTNKIEGFDELYEMVETTYTRISDEDKLKLTDGIKNNPSNYEFFYLESKLDISIPVDDSELSPF